MMWRAKTDPTNATLRTMTTTGSLTRISHGTRYLFPPLVSTSVRKMQETYTFRPGASSVYNFNVVAFEPPAPAALVPAGLIAASFTD